MFLDCCCKKCKSLKNSKPDSVAEGSLTGSEEEERGGWGSKFEFILSAIGYCVGLGTIWRFPIIAYENGGGAFLIPYLIYMVLLGLPLVCLELAYGQFSSLSPIMVWKNMSPLFQGIGYSMVLVSGLVCIYYNVIIAWTLYYFILSFNSVLPWSNCNNEWNTDHCVPKNISIETRQRLDGDHIPNTTATDEFFYVHMLGYDVEGNGISFSNYGTVKWQLCIALFVAWVFIFLCLAKGIQTSGKVVYVTATVPYLVLLILLIRACTLEGADVGIKYYIVPDFSKLLSLKPWSDAATQLFYSMGAAWGALVTMSSYCKFNSNFIRDSVIIAIADTFTAFLTGFVVFATLGFMAHNTGSPIEKVVKQGPGLLFVTFPEAISRMPLPPFWAVLFFIFIFLVGLDSQFGMFETVLSALFDVYPVLRKQKVLTCAVCCFVMFLLGLPMICEGGVLLFHLFYVCASELVLMITAFFECVVVMYIYGYQRFYMDMQMMLGTRPNVIWKYCWLIVTPIIIVFVFLVTILNHKKMTFQGYMFPWWGDLIGWILCVIPILPIPIAIIYCVVTNDAPGTTKQRLWALMMPSADWGPAGSRNRTAYRLKKIPPSIAYKLLKKKSAKVEPLIYEESLTDYDESEEPEEQPEVLEDESELEDMEEGSEEEKQEEPVEEEKEQQTA